MKYFIISLRSAFAIFVTGMILASTAIGRAGDTQDRMITMFAERGGVSGRDIVRIAVGADTSTRILAIKTGNAHATTVDLGIKKLQLGRASRAMIIEGVKNYVRALPQGVPGLPTAEGVKNFLEYDIKIPLQIKDDIPPERLLNLQLVEEVKKDLETAQRRTTK